MVHNLKNGHVSNKNIALNEVLILKKNHFLL